MSGLFGSSLGAPILGAPVKHRIFVSYHHGVIKLTTTPFPPLFPRGWGRFFRRSGFKIGTVVKIEQRHPVEYDPLAWMP